MSLTVDQPAQSGGHRGVEVPWLDYATIAVPDSHELILWWALYLWLSDGNYRIAFQRVADHFITQVQFPDLSTEEESAFKDLFLKHIDIRRELKACADDFLCFGNLFVTLYLPFVRMLICRKCRFEQPIKRLRGQYEVTFSDTGVGWRRKQPCPKCGDTGHYVLKDRNDLDISRLKINRYSPFEIQVAMNHQSHRKEIFWKMPPDVRADIRSGAPIHIEDTPIRMLEAVAKNHDLLFDEDIVLHLDETVVSGFNTRGWGVPRAISCFRTAWLQQVTNRLDQAIAQDYTLGMRIISPGQSPAGVDPMQTHGMAEFVTHVKKMVKEHRRDPASYHTAPYPINYQFAGGEGDNLLPADKLKFRQQEFLNQLGIPLEYHQMSMSVQAAPMALRLFEAAWQSVPTLYNTLLSWIVKVAARNFGHDETAVTMQRTTVADDAMRKQVLLQLMAANQISPQTALEGFGVDAEDEIKKVFTHQDNVAKEQKAHDEQAQQDQEMGAVSALAGAPTPSQMAQQAQGGQGGQPGPGQGMGGVGGGIPGQGQQPSTIQGMSDQADQIAGQLVSMPEYDRKQQLRAIRESNPNLHALVTTKMDKIRTQAASQGQQQLLAPPAAGGAPPAQ